jgi:integrase
MAALFQHAAQSLTTSLNRETIRFYHCTIRNFLNFLGAQYPQVQSLQHLRRDPHIPAWFTSLRSRQPPLATITYTIHLFHLRRMFEELAWTEDLPLLARLVLRQDTPRREHYLPRPLTADQDKIVQQELLRRDDRNSNAFLLLRHTGMRIGECADLSFDCLRLVGPDSWAIHVPLGKLKTERLVPVDSFVFVGWWIASVYCVLRTHSPPTAFSSPARVAATLSSKSCASFGETSSPPSGSPSALSLTSYDTHTARR